MENCPYAIHNERGLTQWLTCSKNKQEMCPFQRRCAEKNRVINSDGAIYCSIRLDNNEV